MLTVLRKRALLDLASRVEHRCAAPDDALTCAAATEAIETRSLAERARGALRVEPDQALALVHRIDQDGPEHHPREMIGAAAGGSPAAQQSDPTQRPDERLGHGPAWEASPGSPVGEWR